MVIKFDKKEKKTICFNSISSNHCWVWYTPFILTNQRETFTLQDEKSKNQYTIDVIYDDETNRILCNESSSLYK